MEQLTAPVRWVESVRTLAGLGFQGTAAFEYEKDGRDPLPGLAESLGYVRGILACWDG